MCTEIKSNAHIGAQLEPNFDKIAIGWSSSKIVSGGPAL
jgi:hypothetical protein